MAKDKTTGKRPRKPLDRRSGKSAKQQSEELPLKGSPEEQPPLQAETRTKGVPIPGMEGSDPGEEVFAPLVLEKTVIALPLFKEFERRKAKIEKEKKAGKEQPEPVYPVIIDVNLLYHAGREEAKRQVQRLIITILKESSFTKKATDSQGVNPVKTKYSQQYVFAVLEEEAIKELVRRDSAGGSPGGGSAPGNQAIYHIWPDFEIKKLTTKSLSTVKADAARNAFSAFGEDIYWAVMDSGIDETHPHFAMHKGSVALISAAHNSAIGRHN